MKFEKQNLETTRMGNVRLDYCDPITSSNIIGFVKQEQRLMPLSLASDLTDEAFSAIIQKGFQKWVSVDSLKDSLRNAAYSRFSHSSDWKEVRYMEKADIRSILRSLFPAVYCIKLINEEDIPAGSIAMEIKHSFDKNVFYPSVELISVMVNKWLFDPAVIDTAECCRIAYQKFSIGGTNVELTLAAFTLYTVLLSKWFRFSFDTKEAQGWVQKN